MHVLDQQYRLATCQHLDREQQRIGHRLKPHASRQLHAFRRSAARGEKSFHRSDPAAKGCIRNRGVEGGNRIVPHPVTKKRGQRGCEPGDTPAHLVGMELYAKQLHRAEPHERFVDEPGLPDPGLAGGPSYSRIARLAESVRPFIAMARGLREAGLHAPAIHDSDARAGLILLDDLGDGRIVDAGGPVAERYEAAIDALAHLHSKDMREAADNYRLPLYALETMLAEVSLACEWYLPWRHGHPAVTKIAEELQAAFRLVLEPVLHPADNKSWTLRDYHSPNIIWIENATGIDRVGIIDFQDALIGPAAYDVASLCMDARVDVSETLEARLLERYCTARGPRFDEEAFRRDYAAMAAQRNSKIIGIFARLALRDGKTRYLAHQPRIAGYLSRALAHPHMKPVRSWYEKHLPEALDARKVLK